MLPFTWYPITSGRCTLPVGLARWIASHYIRVFWLAARSLLQQEGMNDDVLLVSPSKGAANIRHLACLSYWGMLFILAIVYSSLFFFLFLKTFSLSVATNFCSSNYVSLYCAFKASYLKICVGQTIEAQQIWFRYTSVPQFRYWKFCSQVNK